MPSSTTSPSICVNCGKMARVGDVSAIDLAGRQDVDGRLLLLHDAHLHGARVRAQQHVALALDVGPLARKVAHVEGVLQTAGGMVGRLVERGEVVVVQLDLRPLGDAIAQAEKDLDDLGANLLDEVARTDGSSAARQRDVDRLGADARVKSGL